MRPNRQHIVVAGAGAGGLATAWGLARAGYAVTVLEQRAAPCEKQSGPRGGQARLHSGSYYPSNPRVAQAVAREYRHFLAEAAAVVVPVETTYSVPESDRDGILAGWDAAGIPFREQKGGPDHLRSNFRRKYNIANYRLPDRVIDAVRLTGFLRERLAGVLAGVRLVCNASILAARHEGNRVRSVVARTPDGLQTFPTDWLVVVAGAGTRDVLARVDPDANLGACFQTIATAIMRFPWRSAFAGSPATLQLFGSQENQLLKNLSVIPVGSSPRASVATSGGWPADDPEHVARDIEAERQALLGSMGEAFDLRATPEPQELSWCVKALLVNPSVQAREGDAGARLVTVLPGQLFGGSSNVLICSPGKLSGVFSLRDAVVERIAGSQEVPIAA